MKKSTWLKKEDIIELYNLTVDAILVLTTHAYKNMQNKPLYLRAIDKMRKGKDDLYLCINYDPKKEEHRKKTKKIDVEEITLF